MATVQEKINELQNVKADIKQALVNKGVDMTGVPFTGYAGKVGESGSDKFYILKNGIFTIDNDFKIADNHAASITKNAGNIRLRSADNGYASYFGFVNTLDCTGYAYLVCELNAVQYGSGGRGGFKNNNYFSAYGSSNKCLFAVDVSTISNWLDCIYNFYMDLTFYNIWLEKQPQVAAGGKRTYVYKDGSWNSSFIKSQEGSVTFNASDIKMGNSSKLMIENVPKGSNAFVEVYCTQRSNNVDDVNYGIHIMVQETPVLSNGVTMNRITPIYYQDNHTNKKHIFGIGMLSSNLYLTTGPSQTAYISKIWYE